ncbi:Uncharacterized protein UPF0065 [Verminephrobacter eiseniae EF01-2]|uniref:Uncharacterized protein UPF0065 n=2 Tax=Verminephrobacter eiseniae TaxID=364317 RepID=A1WHK7_VEREI|nr:Uncharacterized protein UPF0065 [Verminephrobacter eiseniae EF01-2]
MGKSMKHISSIVIAGLAFLSCSGLALAAPDWPTKPITLVVPFSAGGGNDSVARLLAPALGEELGQSVVIDNRAGAGGTVGAGVVAQAAPDGYTLLICSTGNLAVATAVYPKLGYRIQDFAPIAHIANTPTIWVAAPQVPAGSLKEFISLAKREPGKHNYASSGNGTTPHLAGAAMATRNGLEMQHIPYKGSAAAYPDLAGGRVSVMMDAIISALPLVEAGRVKGLAVGTAQRLPQIPSVPTLAEQGLADMGYTGWVGLCAPRGTPAPVVEKISRGVKAALGRRNMRDFLVRQMAEPVGDGPGKFSQTIGRDAATWRDIAKSSGITLD